MLFFWLGSLLSDVMACVNTGATRYAQPSTGSTHTMKRGSWLRFHLTGVPSGVQRGQFLLTFSSRSSRLACGLALLTVGGLSS